VINTCLTAWLIFLMSCKWQYPFEFIFKIRTNKKKKWEVEQNENVYLNEISFLSSFISYYCPWPVCRVCLLCRLVQVILWLCLSTIFILSFQCLGPQNVHNCFQVLQLVYCGSYMITAILKFTNCFGGRIQIFVNSSNKIKILFLRKFRQDGKMGNVPGG
jgi:hypothetical protein